MPPCHPYLRAAAVYDREPCARPFEEDLFLHLLHGTVISTPEVFAMVRPVSRDWPLERLLDPREVAPHGDAWWVWLLAGEVARLFSHGPAKKWVAFERRNTPRWHSYDRLRRFFGSRSAPVAGGS